jgi:type II secretory pathway pseudopilin PulG
MMDITFMLEGFQEPHWRWESTDTDASSNSDSGGTPLLKRAIQWLKIQRYSKTQLVNDLSRCMNQEIAYSRLPYASPTPALLIPAHPILATGIRLYGVEHFKFTLNETQNRLLAATLALQAYRLDHGRYPDSLSELAPRCLSRVPDDPFGLNTSLRYRRVGASYLLYSIGPDGKDDGGAPIKAVAPGRQPYSQPESKGDIVAEANPA